MHANDPEMAKKWEKEGGKLKREKYMKIRELIKKLVREELSETSKRDYKDEYKKFQSSDKSKKYRAELNKYNRNKGTYGNGDGKDASHKGGKISGFEKESVNRGRKEKSRLKKEQKLNEIPKLKMHTNRSLIKYMDKTRDFKKYRANPDQKGDIYYEDVPVKLFKKHFNLEPKVLQHIDMDNISVKGNKKVDIYNESVEQKLREAIRKIFREDFAGSYPESKRKSFDGKRRKQSEVLGYKLTGTNDVKTEIDDATIKEASMSKWMEHQYNTIVNNAINYSKEQAIKDKSGGSKQTPKLIAIKTINNMKELRNKGKDGPLKKMLQNTLNVYEKAIKKKIGGFT